MARVIISTGHTNNDPGTQANGLREVDVARAIAKATLPHLRGNGVLSLSVPYELGLKEKIEWINNTGYKEEFNDIAVEIHLNEDDGNKYGVEVWYRERGNNKSQSLAETILTSISSDTKLAKKGTYSELDHELGKLAFVHNTVTTSVLVECGYIDNKRDAEYLKDENNIQDIGKSLAKGILKHLDIEYKEVKIQNTQAPKANRPLPNIPKTSPVPSSNQPSTPTTPVSMPQPPMSATPPKPYSPPIGGMKPTGGAATAGGSSYMANREDRKTMIKEMYIKVLGREPNQSDLNYFLNTGITEDQLIKKMVESQEHADLVKSRQEILTTKAEYHAQQAELIQLRAETQDKSALINNLNTLLAQKNLAITELQRRLHQFNRQQSSSQPNEPQYNKPSYNEPLTDKIFKFFSDRLG